MNATFRRLLGSAPLALFQAGWSTAARAQAPDEPIAPLRPPKAELPPGFWAQNGFWVMAAVVVLLTLIAAVALLRLKLKAPPAPAPFKRARQTLEPLLSQPEDGQVLTRASQAVKGYFQTAFPLPQGELTTAEFCRALEREAQIGPELGAALGDFLRRCDRRKFAALTSPEPLHAARAALDLVDAGERQRLELARQADKAQPA